MSYLPWSAPPAVRNAVESIHLGANGDAKKNEKSPGAANVDIVDNKVPVDKKTANVDNGTTTAEDIVIQRLDNFALEDVEEPDDKPETPLGLDEIVSRLEKIGVKEKELILLDCLVKVNEANDFPLVTALQTHFPEEFKNLNEIYGSIQNISEQLAAMDRIRQTLEHLYQSMHEKSRTLKITLP